MTTLSIAKRIAAAPWPDYAPDELAAAQCVLASGHVNYWTGDEGRQFEREYAAYLGREHAIALANGTVALELALIALGVGPGAEVVTSPRTFIASASAAIMRGATPVLADVDRESGNITSATIEAVLTPRTRAIIVVHLAGWPCDMQPIMELARHHGLAVIEDCAQAHGARYRDVPVGSIGDVAAFSFCQDKIVTTAGEGGLLALDDEAMWRAAWAFKDHGKDFDAVFNRDHPPGYRWLHESFGTNWRLTELQSAVGRLQLAKLDDWVTLRRRNASILDRHLAGIEVVRTPRVPDHSYHAYYKYYAYLRPEALAGGWNRDRIQDELAGLGVVCRVGSCSEIYQERAFVEAKLAPEKPLAVARELGETSIMFMVHPTIDQETMHAIGGVVANVLQRATR